MIIKVLWFTTETARRNDMVKKIKVTEIGKSSNKGARVKLKRCNEKMIKIF